MWDWARSSILRIDGGKLNELTKSQGGRPFRMLDLDGREYLFYKAFPIHVAILRGTTADPDGNITMEKEALTLEVAFYGDGCPKLQGGLVIVQVKRTAERGTLNPRQVKIPGISGRLRGGGKTGKPLADFWRALQPAHSVAKSKCLCRLSRRLEMSGRKIIVRRAAFELKPNSIVNLGIGMPEGVSGVAHEERVLEYVTLTAESRNDWRASGVQA